MEESPSPLYRRAVLLHLANKVEFGADGELGLPKRLGQGETGTGAGRFL